MCTFPWSEQWYWSLVSGDLPGSRQGREVLREAIREQSLQVQLSTFLTLNELLNLGPWRTRGLGMRFYHAGPGGRAKSPAISWASQMFLEEPPTTLPGREEKAATILHQITGLETPVVAAQICRLFDLLAVEAVVGGTSLQSLMAECAQQQGLAFAVDVSNAILRGDEHIIEQVKILAAKGLAAG